MTFNSDFLSRYLELTPAALAIERSLECEIHIRNVWQSPILDIGCGDGIFAKVLFAEKIDTGIDPSSAEIARARELRVYKELIVCSGDRIPKPNGSYRTIFSNSVLEHIPDVLPVLKEAHRLLAADGCLYLTIPTDQFERASLLARTLQAIGLGSLAERYGTFYNRFWGHYHAYKQSRWRELFSEAGLEVVQERLYDPRNVATLNDILTVFAIPSLVAKNLMGRWILCPRLRRMTARLINAGMSPIVHILQRGEGGCLVFYELRKRRNQS